MGLNREGKTAIQCCEDKGTSHRGFSFFFRTAVSAVVARFASAAQASATTRRQTPVHRVEGRRAPGLILISSSVAGPTVSEPPLSTLGKVCRASSIIFRRGTLKKKIFSDFENFSTFFGLGKIFHFFFPPTCSPYSVKRVARLAIQ